MSTLVPSPFSEKSLRDFDRNGQGGTGMTLQPYKGKWLVSQRGEAMGDVRRTMRQGVVHWEKEPYGGPGGRQSVACELAAKLLEEYLQEHAEPAKPVMPAASKKTILAIYKRFNVSDKMIRGGKHIVHFTGHYAERYGVGHYTNVTLEDLSTEDLERAAKAVGIS